MIERIILQVIGILIIGEYLFNFLYSSESKKLNEYILDKFIGSVILGYSSLIGVMLISGVFFPGTLDTVTFVYFSISMILTVRLLFYIIINYRSYSINFDYDTLPSYLFYLTSTILLGYTALFLIMPERGWDALHFYLPNALYFFIEDSIIPTLNPLSFYPTFKPPVNTLYLTYSFYVAKGMYAQLHPLIFLLGSTAIVYQISLILTDEVTVGFLSVLTLLTYPLVYFLVIEFAFYQELPIMFFSAASLYYLLKMENTGEYNKLLLVLSISMGILSKLSGFAIVFVIFMLVKFDRKYEIFQVSLITGIGLYLTRKAALDIFVGTAIIVLLLLIIAVYLITHTSSQFNYSYIELAQVMIIPIVVGVLWILFMLQIPNLDRLLVDTYVETDGGKNPWQFPAALYPADIFLEHGLQASFTASSLFLFTGAALSPVLILFKLDGCRRYKQFPILFRWIVVYLLLFYAYFSAVSARYFVPILVPMSVIFANSIFQFLSRLDLSAMSKFSLVSVIFGLNSLFYFPILPLRVLRDNILHIFFYYHKAQLAVMIYLIVIVLLIVKLQRLIPTFSPVLRKTLTGISLLLLLLPSVVAPTGIVIYAGVTEQTLEESSSLYYREQYQELVSQIDRIPLRVEDVIMSVNTPGLEYFTSQRVLDIFLISGHEEFDRNLRLMNMTEAADFVDEIGIEIIVTLNEAHYFYDIYTEEFQDLALMQLTNTAMFERVYTNSEFHIFIKSD